MTAQLGSAETGALPGTVKPLLSVVLPFSLEDNDNDADHSHIEWSDAIRARLDEVELIEEGMVHRTKLGWADTMFTSHANQNLGVGDDKHSWSFCPSNDDGDRGVIGDRALKCFNGGREVWGDRWRPRDVIGVAVRLLATY